MLKNIFTTLAGSYSKDLALLAGLWHGIENEYTAKGRHYHNLMHLENMFFQLELCKNLIQDWDTALFALFYHDIIYKATAKDNEERSAAEAVSALKKVSFPGDKTAKCTAMILATKSHSAAQDNDTNLFTDADLSILGSDWEEYSVYCKNIRREYAVYPDFMYNPGRKKVLQHFTDMQYIFKTRFFRQRHEEKARENLQREIGLL